MKKKLLIFPFTYCNREIVMYRKYMEEYTLVAAVVQNKAELEQIAEKSEKFEDILITEKFEDALSVCDAVLFLENNNMNASIYKNYMQKVEDSNKEVFFSNKCLKILDVSATGENMLSQKREQDRLQLPENTYIKYIDIPVVGVMGLGDFCNKFCTEIEISYFFRKKGYKVIHFGSKDFNGTIGEKIYPDFLFNQGYSVTQRILKWNQYLFELCEREKPDLLILGLPGAIMPMNNKILNEFGEIPFIISNGIRIDVGVLCSYFHEKVDQKYLFEYKNYCKYKLNCDVKWICVSNSSCRFNPDSEESVLEYLHYEPERADEMVVEAGSGEKIILFNVLNESKREEMLQQLYNELTENVSAF